jgi:hypothetical protein
LKTEDTRGIPLRISDLEPYTVEELEEFIRPHYLSWLRAGGLERYIQGEASFWINLWDITEGEQEKQISWYLPEVNSGTEKEVEDQEGKEIPNKKEGGHHQSLHSSDSYHQGMLPEPETQHQKRSNYTDTTRAAT